MHGLECRKGVEEERCEANIPSIYDHRATATLRGAFKDTILEPYSNRHHLQAERKFMSWISGSTRSNGRVDGLLWPRNLGLHFEFPGAACGIIPKQRQGFRWLAARHLSVERDGDQQCGWVVVWCGDFVPLSRHELCRACSQIRR
jgi:hypothetical protein